MINVRYDTAGNRHISVFGNGVRIVELKDGVRFRIHVGETTVEAPETATDLTWSRGCARIELSMATVHHQGRPGRIPVWLIRFKKSDRYADWNSVIKPVIRVWLTVVIPMNQ